jgi:hypothetical protein
MSILFHRNETTRTRYLIRCYQRCFETKMMGEVLKSGDWDSSGVIIGTLSSYNGHFFIPRVQSKY